MTSPKKRVREVLRGKIDPSILESTVEAILGAVFPQEEPLADEIEAEKEELEKGLSRLVKTGTISGPHQEHIRKCFERVSHGPNFHMGEVLRVARRDFKPRSGRIRRARRKALKKFGVTEDEVIR